MDYFCFIQSVVSYVENRVKVEFDQAGLERVTGYSLPHIREVFKDCTKMPLARYVLYRKLSNAAFEMVHTEKKILDIAVDYGFESYDTFTRAFRRFAGVNPSEFRNRGYHVGRSKLTAGVYGPGIITNEAEKILVLPPYPEENEFMKEMKKTTDGCILYGVPKVQYTFEECTPFPQVLKVCLNYMGQEISYAWLMAASGAAFRLRWNTTCWDGGNVGIAFIYEDLNEAYKRSFRAAGRSYRMLERKPDVTKNDFINFIKAEIDEGRPVIALGIIGPPEACIITGYRDQGQTLLGWNFFQENPEFARDCEIDRAGYFICRNWWENPSSIGLMSIGEEKGSGTDGKEILENALEILSKERIGVYAGGPDAFNAWARALSDESQFPKDAVLPLLFERLMCQTDAIVMIGEGRSYAAHFLEWVAENHEHLRESARKAARYFKEVFPLTSRMVELLGGFQQGEEQARRLTDPMVRREIVKLIMKAKELDQLATAVIREIVANM